MNDTLKAVIIEVTGGNVRNHHVDLRGAFGMFPDDCLGGNNAAAAGKTIEIQIGSTTVNTDIDESKAIFRERVAIRSFFAEEAVVEGDLVMIERLGPRSYAMSKISRRAFAYHL